MYTKKQMKSALETLMFAIGEPLSIKDASKVLDDSPSVIKDCLEELSQEYEQEGRGIRIRRLDDCYQFVTTPANDAFVSKLCTPVRIKKLSQAALEVLAIIAYRQPVSKSEIDSIRGVKSERVIDGLMEKGLVAICGRSEAIGKPYVYGTTTDFLAKFGFESLDELPDISEYDEIRRPSDEEELHGQITLDFTTSDEN